MMKLIDNPQKTREALDTVSPSFCLAKWYQVTIHLQTGMAHSCHHPMAIKIPLEEIKADPSALHNNIMKKLHRKEMLEGVRPTECDYCWKTEDASPESFSDRHYKSSEFWTAEHFDEARNGAWDANYTPSYVEVSFGNVCNFKCSYCAPHVSSRWMEEVKQYGGYKLADNGEFNSIAKLIDEDSLPIPNNEYNPYIEAWWKWWPALYPKLKVFRITGGEPLMNRNTFKTLDYIVDNPNPQLELAVNTNLGIPEENLSRFINVARRIQSESKIRSLVIFTSAEAHGRSAEYIRNGLDYDKWLSNCHRVLSEIPNSKLIFMSTYNALSVTTFDRFLDDVIELKKFYPRIDHGTKIYDRVIIDIPYLRYPFHQTVQVLTPEYADMVLASYKKMSVDNKAYFYDIETEKLKRIHDWMQSGPTGGAHINRDRADFYRFFTEHDRRRGTNFLEVFPEMQAFWETCKAISDAK